MRAHIPFIIVLLLTTGCSTTLHMRSGVDLAGDIERADEQYIYVIVDETESTLEERNQLLTQAEALRGEEGRRGDGRLYRVRRDRVKSMAFPGLALAITGTVMQAVGFAVAAGGLLSANACVRANSGGICGLGEFLFFIAPGAGVGGIGTAMMISGWTVYGNARSDSDPAPPVDRVSLQPFAAPTKDGGATAGAQATLAW